MAFGILMMVVGLAYPFVQDYLAQVSEKNRFSLLTAVFGLVLTLGSLFTRYYLRIMRDRRIRRVLEEEEEIISRMRQ